MMKVLAVLIVGGMCLIGPAEAAELVHEGQPFGWQLRDRNALLQFGGDGGAAGDAGAGDAGAAASSGDSGNSGEGDGGGNGEGCGPK